MDPLTQATLGAAMAAAFSSKERIRLAVCVGAAAGAAPDLDIFIRSDADPLLALQYHRHFTHALLVAPVLGCIVGLLFKLVFLSKKLPLKELLLYGVAGAFTHGFLDACTSYGTLLYWPLSHHRESWDIISIIDPIFTLPLFFLTLFAFAWKWPPFAKLALILCGLYFGFSLYQRHQATQYVLELAESRGHDAQDITVRPSFGNIVLWRLIYRDGQDYYVDAVRILPGAQSQFYEGSSVSVFGVESAAMLVPGDTIAAEDIERFRFFSQGYLYRAKMNEFIIGDLRYSMFPNSVVPLWGIYLDPLRAHERVKLRHFRDSDLANWKRLWHMIKGKPLEDFSVENL